MAMELPSPPTLAVVLLPYKPFTSFFSFSVGFRFDADGVFGYCKYTKQKGCMSVI